MNFTEYQLESRAFAIYPKEMNTIYPALGLCGEAGEVAEKIKKWIRGGTLDDEALQKEMGDVLWYLANLASDRGFMLEDIAVGNIEKLSDRRNRNVLHGEGDDR